MCSSEKCITEVFLGAFCSQNSKNGQENDEQPTPIPSTTRPIRIRMMIFFDPPGGKITIEVPMVNRMDAVKIMARRPNFSATNEDINTAPIKHPTLYSRVNRTRNLR